MDNSLIKRQAAINTAIDTVDDWDGGCNKERERFIREALEELPSTQTERWDTCFDCPLSHGCPVINGCTNEQAMQYAGDIPDNCPLNKLERKGKWIYYDPNGFKCSRCGRYLEIECGDVKMNFCPHCGNYNGDEHNE